MGLGHVQGFPGQGGLVHAQGGRGHQPGVGTDAVPLGKQDEVARHQGAGLHPLRDSLAQQAGMFREHAAHGLGGFFGLEFLPEAEGAVDDVHGPDGNGQLWHARHQGHGPGGPEQQGHEVDEVGQKFEQQGCPFDNPDDVGAMARQTYGGLLPTQPLGVVRSAAKTSDGARVSTGVGAWRTGASAMWTIGAVARVRGGIPDFTQFHYILIQGVRHPRSPAGRQADRLRSAPFVSPLLALRRPIAGREYGRHGRIHHTLERFTRIRAANSQRFLTELIAALGLPPMPAA